MDWSRRVYSPSGSSNLFLNIGSMNSNFCTYSCKLSLSFSTLHSSSLWRTDTIVFAKLNNSPVSIKPPPQRCLRGHKRRIYGISCFLLHIHYHIYHNTHIVKRIGKRKKRLRLFNIISTTHCIIINMPCTSGHKLSLLVAYYVPDFFSVLTTDANHHERHIQLSEEVAW